MEAEEEGRCQTTHVHFLARWKKKEGGSVDGCTRAKGLLGGVHHVKEAILVLLALIHLRDGSRHRHHAVAVDQQEKGLVRV